MNDTRFPETYSLPETLTETEAPLLKKAEDNKVVARIWDRDHTLWRPDPTEIADRLGWLDLPTTTGETLEPARKIARDLRSREPKREVRNLVLLGMGGSSLCPLVLARIIGSDKGFPHLHVLDTTHPGWIGRIRQSIDLSTTLFLVSSKSGGTIEVMSALSYFWEGMSRISSKPGGHFVAITDPGTSLADLAEKRGFLRTFENPPDIGGRFSALSLFGMVPATLMGIDENALLRSGAKMAESCRETEVQNNPGARLGMFLSTCHAAGRDKLTILTSQGLESLGLWIEQLIAESLGKDEKGILPIACEPTIDPGRYGEDRAFAAIRRPGDEEVGQLAKDLAEKGHPVCLFDLVEETDLGAEFFRWEFATAFAGHFLDVQPFDQPNVQEAKLLTSEFLEKPDASIEGVIPFEDLIEDLQPGDFFSIMTYLEEESEVEEAVQGLRAAVLETRNVATTSGYGPRFLHSTGQYHKGGPNKGHFLQIVERTAGSIPIPGQPYDFDFLCAAQANGDFQALAAKGRRVSRIEVGFDPASDIEALTEVVRGDGS